MRTATTSSQTTTTLFTRMKAKFRGTCATSGLPIQVGEEIAFIHKTKTVHKLLRVFPNQSAADFHKGHSVWLFVQAVFNNWLNLHAGNDPEIAEMYFGPDAVYEASGAIEQAIENAIEEADQTQKPVYLFEFDLDSAFSG